MKKAKKPIGIIKHLNSFLPLKTLQQMYKSLVRPHLEYCDVVFHLPPIVKERPFQMHLPALMMKVESIQWQAALAVTGTWQGSSRSKLYEELGWESLDNRRMCKRILQLHKIIDNITPYLRAKLPPNRSNLINLPYIFQEINCRTTRYRNSFYPDATISWNNTLSLFETFPSIDVLKKEF